MEPRDWTRAGAGEPETWAELASWCREHGGSRLSAKEREFLVSIGSRFMRGREPTPAQEAWLRDIRKKLLRGAGR